MGLGGYAPPETPKSELIVAYAFYILTILYPLPLAVSLLASLKTLRSYHAILVISLACLPIAYLFVLVVLASLFPS